MRTCFITLSKLLVALYCAAPAWADPVRIATWNIANLHYETGVPLRDRASARSEADYALLREYRDRVGADVWALQEVNGPKAVRRVFPEDEWDVFVSGRYAEDMRTGAETDRIYTALAVRRGAFDAVAPSDVEALSARDDAGRPTRWGVELLLERDGARLLLLNVHLKTAVTQGR